MRGSERRSSLQVSKTQCDAETVAQAAVGIAPDEPVNQRRPDAFHAPQREAGDHCTNRT